MGALAVHLKATYMQMRRYIWFILMFILLGKLAEEMVSYFADSGQGTTLSVSNMLILLLLLLAIVLPLSYYRRIVHIGASRKQYFWGLHFVLAVWSAAIALANSLWLEVEVHVLRNHESTVGLIDAFHWDDFGWAGSFLYQTVFYMMATALLSMLVSGYARFAGWLLWALLSAAIPVGTSIPSLRVHVVSFFDALLFNGSLLAGVGFNLVLFLVFATGGWLFTRGRAY